MALRSAFVAAAGLVGSAMAADSCSNTLKVDYPAPVAADGWSYRLVANGFTKPRGILFDNDGGLVVVDSGVGLKHLALKDDGGTCVSVDKQTTLVESEDLNHGLAISDDGRTIYASSSDSVFSWSYNSTSVSLSDNNRTLVSNMSNSDHTTRTLLVSRQQPNLLLVSRGSDENEDADAEEKNSGHSQIRSFNLGDLDSGDDAYDFLDGKVLGWGLRNSVGVAEHPETGGVWSVENSVDEMTRDGQDIHENNPAEELNFHGYLNGSTSDQGGNYGYPLCYALWSTKNVPGLGGLGIGDQFPGSESSTMSDESCNKDYVAPRLVFQAHTAPLDIKFTDNGTDAYITFHGSWNREDPVGYRISRVAFSASSGAPTAAHDSTDAAVDVLTNPDLANCPDDCFRPVGLAWDSQGRLWFSSDSTGEIFVLEHDGSSSSDGDSGSGSGSEDDEDAGVRLGPGSAWAVSLVAVVVGMMLA